MSYINSISKEPVKDISSEDLLFIVRHRYLECAKQFAQCRDPLTTCVVNDVLNIQEIIESLGYEYT